MIFKVVEVGGIKNQAIEKKCLLMDKRIEGDIAKK